MAGLVRQIGQGLGAAHDKKIWHRDLKPENIMLQTLPGGDEHVKLIDFGIATITDLEKKDTGTRIAGSLPYMAPEQISGRPSAATDVYAFGVIAYEMLTGRKPFTPDDASQLASQQRDGVRLKPSTLRPAISGTAERLILRSLSYNPNDRPASARVFGDDLSHSLLAAEIARQTQSQPTKPSSRRVWVSVAALAVAVGLAGMWFYRGQRAPAPPGSPKQTATTETPKETAAGPNADSNSTDQVELAFWNSISTSTDPRLYREYLAKYPRGKFADLAKLKLEPASGKPTTPQQTTHVPAAPTVNPPKLPASRPTAPPGFTAIFNGKDLSGWRGRQADYSPHAEARLSKEDLAAKQIQWNSERDLHWTVDSAKGEIVCDGKGVHLATAKDYTDFELYVDWLIDHNGDSGIYLRSYPQVQIWDPDNPRQVAAQRGSGALWNNRPDNPGKWPLVKADNPVGHWNTFHIKMVGARVWVWLNGKQTVDGQILDNSYDRSLPLVSKGAIELQAYGSEIHFRNIYIHEILADRASSGASPDPLQPALPAGATNVNPRDGLTYVWIQQGTFQLGCLPGDSECRAEEKPAHQVTITTGFWMGQTEVTQEAYQHVMGTNPSFFKGAKLPVEEIIWNDAQSYCLKVDMRLPTEAEWEYAARAGGNRSRYGDLDGIAWYNANSGSKTHEVGLKQANAWGLHDTLGNVLEWVADWYSDYPPGNVTTRKALQPRRTGRYGAVPGPTIVGSREHHTVAGENRQPTAAISVSGVRGICSPNDLSLAADPLPFILGIHIPHRLPLHGIAPRASGSKSLPIMAIIWRARGSDFFRKPACYDRSGS